jgi:hypothetical protein
MDGILMADPTPAVSGTGEPGARVVVTLGGQPVCAVDVAADGTWSCAPATPLPDGTVVLDVAQTDAAGNGSPSARTTFTVDATPPDAPVVTGPADGALESNATPMITGTGEPGGRVVVKHDGAPVCAADVAADGTWRCAPLVPFPEGPVTLWVAQTDAAGNGSPFADTAFTVDTTPPVLTLDPSDGTTIAGTTDPGVTVTIADGSGAPVPGCLAVVADARGGFSCAPTAPLADGVTVRVTATDAAGNLAWQSVVVAVPASAPEVVVPTGGAVPCDGLPWLCAAVLALLGAGLLTVRRPAR